MTVRLETPSTQAHFEQWAAIMERVEGDVYDVEELAHVIQGDDESAWLLASLAYEPVGCGFGRPSSIAGSLYAMARVLPEHRRQGVGTRLYEALSEHAARLGLGSLWGRIEDGDTASLRFAGNRGFREVGREYEVVLDVAEADLAGDAPDGVELVSLAERPELVRPLYDVDVEVGRTSPATRRATSR